MREEILGIKTMGEKINNLFKAAYKRHEIFVNRKYQRKLVWTLQEKQAFIDTLLRGYPVPLFLFAKTKDGKEREIIDGLQRLDAIFSFIKNEFPVMWEGKEQYCNKTALFCPRESFKQKKPVLDFDLCMTFGEYELPTTTTDFADTDTINEIFKRINSFGRKLARQELRQAGVVSNFSELIRKTAAEIRGDKTTQDYINIFDMPAISLSDDGLQYGIEMGDMFWIKNDIITDTEIRNSKDEETLAQIFGYMLFGKNCGASASVLDTMYNSSNRYYKKFESSIKNRGQLEWINDFLKVQSQLEKILETSEKTFTDLLFDRRNTRGKSKIYIALFLAIWELKVEGKIIGDPVKAARLLENICSSSDFSKVTKENSWKIEIRNSIINFFKQRLETITVVKKEKLFNEIDGDLVQLLNKMSDVKTEMSNLELKVGIHTFGDNKIQKGVIHDVMKTYTAMNNLKSNKTSYIVLGIADNAVAAKDFEKIYGDKCIGYAGCFVTGLDSEINNFHGASTDKFLQKFKEVIKKTPVSDEIKKRFYNDMSVCNYCGRLILVIRCNFSGTLYKFQNIFYTRHLSNTEKVDLTSEEWFNMLQDKKGKMLPVI